MLFDFSVLNNFLSTLKNEYSQEEWEGFLKSDPRVAKIVKVLNEWNVKCIASEKIQKIDLSEGDFEYLASPFLDTMRALEGRKMTHWISTIGIACQEGPLECVQWMINTFYRDLSTDQREELFRLACAGGQPRIAKWIRRSSNLIDIRYAQDRPFRTSCANGQLTMAEWLLELDPTIDIFAVNFHAFDSACAFGHLHVAKWLYALALERKYEETSLITVLSNALEEAVYRNHLKILEWILELIPKAITTREDFECYLEIACDSGSLEVAQWMCGKYPQFKVRTELVGACLIHASNRGRSSMVQWLVEAFNADVAFRDHQALRNALLNKHFELARYLISKSPNLTFGDPS